MFVFTGCTGNTVRTIGTVAQSRFVHTQGLRLGATTGNQEQRAKQYSNPYRHESRPFACTRQRQILPQERALTRTKTAAVAAIG